MDKENRVVVVAKDGKANVEILTGSAFHILNDDSRATFKTGHITDFVGYVEKYKWPVEVYYSESSLVAISRDCADDPARNIKIIAICDLAVSIQLKRIVQVNFNTFKMDQLEEILSTMKRYTDSNGIVLLDKAKDLRFSKVTEVVRKKDNRGNFEFTIARKEGKDELSAPEKILFTVPLYEYHTDKISVEFDVFFNYSETDDGIIMTFQLKNFELDRIIKDTQEGVILKYVEPIDCPKWRGALDIRTGDDSWRYLKNQ